MSATVASRPVTPASACRPLQYTVQRTDPSGSAVAFIRPADAADVLAYGVALDDIIVEHGTIIGDVPATVGQTVNLYQGCGPYNGVHTILTVVDSTHMVIDAEDFGEYIPPGSPTGALRIWLNNYTIWARLSVWTDPAGDPQTVDMHAQPDVDGLTTLQVHEEVSWFFSSDIHPYALPVGGGEVVQSAHGLTALFYSVRFAELYDGSGSTDPFDGDHWIEEEEEDQRVAVNGIHPYAEVGVDGSVGLTWETEGMGSFVVGDITRRFMTRMPRTITMLEADRFRVHLLSNVSLGSLDPYEVDFVLRVFDFTGGVFGGEILDKVITLTGEHAAFSVAVGPADLAPFMSVPERYRLYISNDNENILSEVLDITVDTACKEVRRPFTWLNKLGGCDGYTMTGREISHGKSKRATLRKPMGAGTGYDWSEREYRSEPERFHTISSAPLEKDVRHWLATDLMEQPLKVSRISNTQAAPVIILTDEVITGNTGPFGKPLTFDYRFGTDNMSQRS